MIPTAPEQYSRADQQANRAEIRRELERCVKKNTDIEPEPGRIILRSANGTRYYLSVSNAGALSAVAV